MAVFTNREKMREAQREIGQRQWVYPKRIDAGKLKQADADRQIAIMREIAEEYRAAAEQEDKAGRLL